MFGKKRSPGERYAFDESIFRPELRHRVALPRDKDLLYEEVQHFDQVWMWALLGIQLLVIMIPLLLTGQDWGAILVSAAVMALTMALMSSLSLWTRIDADGVHYRMKWFHRKARTIPWEEIDQIYVRKYAPIREYGGWGIRYGRQGRAFNVKGSHGIQIVKKDGKKILLGTQRPEAAALHLSEHPLLV